MAALHERIATLRDTALRLRERVGEDALRTRLDVALRELERIPQAFPDEAMAQQALLVPAGRIRTVAEIIGPPPSID